MARAGHTALERRVQSIGHRSGPKQAADRSAHRRHAFHIAGYPVDMVDHDPDGSLALDADTAVWFDLDGTLVRVGDYGTVLERACADASVAFTPDLRDAYDDRFLHHFEALVADPYGRAAAEAVPDADSDAFAAALREAEFAAAETPDPLRAALVDLAADDRYALGVLTNGVAEWQRDKLERVGLADRFDAVVASYDVGAHKPDPAPFERAEALLPADERVMVGDDPEADVAAARERGWRAVRVDGPADVPAALDSLR